MASLMSLQAQLAQLKQIQANSPYRNAPQKQPPSAPDASSVIEVNEFVVRSFT